MEFIYEILKLNDWMSPQMCTPIELFRYFITFMSISVAISYFVFAFFVEKVNRNLKIVLNSQFFKYLKYVFIFCALAHFVHGLTYIHQYFKLFFLLIYPPLVYFHLRLILSIKEAIKRILNYKKIEIAKLKKENIRLKKLLNETK